MVVLDIMSKKPEMPKEAVKDIEEFSNFFNNVISEIDKELGKKDEVKRAKAKGEEFIFPLRLIV